MTETHAETHDPTPQGAGEVESEVEDYQRWRRSQRAKRGGGKRVRIFGRVVEMPTSLPLGLTLEEEHLRDASSASLDDVKQVVAFIYGPDALEHWARQGADLEDFQVLLAFGYAHASGEPITFDEAAERAEKARAEEAARERGQGGAQGKAPRKKTKKRRGPGGGSPATGRAW